MKGEKGVILVLKWSYRGVIRGYSGAVCLVDCLAIAAMV